MCDDGHVWGFNETISACCFYVFVQNPTGRINKVRDFQQNEWMYLFKCLSDLMGLYTFTKHHSFQLFVSPDLLVEGNILVVVCRFVSGTGFFLTCYRLKHIHVFIYTLTSSSVCCSHSCSSTELQTLYLCPIYQLLSTTRCFQDLSKENLWNTFYSSLVSFTPQQINTNWTIYKKTKKGASLSLKDKISRRWTPGLFLLLLVLVDF